MHKSLTVPVSLTKNMESHVTVVQHVIIDP